MGDVDAVVNYLCREKHFRHVQKVVEEVATKRGWEGKLVFWKCVGLGQEGNVNEAIVQLEELRRKRDFEFAAVEALLHFHGGVKLQDAGAIAELESVRKDCEARANDAAMLLAASFLFHVDELSRARKLTDRVLEKNSMHVKANALRGWIEVMLAKEKASTRRDVGARSLALQYFDQALNADRSGKKDLDALMGKAYFFTTINKLADAQEELDQAIVAYQWFLPALVEKAKVLMLLGNWDLAVETAERVLQEDPNDIGSLQVVAIYKLTHESNPREACDSLQMLSNAMDMYEPENPELWFEASKPFARVAQRSDDVLQCVVRFVERAKRARPDHAGFATEYAYQLSLMQKYDAAFAAYEHASQLDESNGNALFGQIYCLVKRGDLDEAEQQLEFLSVLQETIGRTAQVAFLEACLCWQKKRDLARSLKLLNETVHLHVKSIQGKVPGTIYDHFVNFNPDFMIEIAKEYLQHTGTEPMDPTETPPQHLQNGIKLLEKVIKFVPCMLSAQIALARARFVSNNLGAATKAVKHCLGVDPNFADGHLVMAQIQLHNEDFQGAKASLEQALSHNFEIRDSITFRLVKARVMVATGDLDEARYLLQGTLELPGVKVHTVDSQTLSALSSSSSSKPRKRSVRGLDEKAKSVTLQERVSVFLQLASVYVLFKETDKAKAVIGAARKEFKGTALEVSVIVKDAEIALKRNDIKGALRMLNEIPAESPAFMKAHLVKAKIFLDHRNDKDAFIRCYLDLVEQNPTAHSHVLLGEAYMKVGQPDEAIEAFKEALKRNPKDSTLAKRIGKVLVSTHDYTRAIDYYKSALRSATDLSGRHSLRYDLAELYLNLKKLDKAEKELLAALADLEHNPDGESKGSDSGASIGELTAQIRALQLLAKVHEGQGENEKVMEVLNQARGVQSRIISAARSGSSSELVQQQKVEMARICNLLACHVEAKQGNDEEAIALYNEALRYDASSVPSLLALAKVYLSTGDLERCHNQCATIMRVDEHNEEASMMLADLMFQRNEFKVAIYHFQQLLERNPSNFQALAKLVSLLFRAGELDTAERYFQLAEHRAPRVVHDPGFGYCKGLFHRYNNSINDAISQFNKARRDVVWGERALTQMIEIYLNPDNANLWEDEGSVVDGTAGSNSEAIRTAQKLLEEMQDKDGINYRILEAYSIMASKNRPDVEVAFQRLVEIVQEYPDHVPSLLALSTALMMMKQTPKARNKLKQISKMPYDQNEADSFEKCWLLLADIFVSSGKYDLAQELCKRCLQYNRSCARAWEYLGMIMEKEASYADAAEHYEQAWHFQKMSSASVGYKLAFNYLKAKRNVEAIDVANKVLKQFPQYPRIKKDILDKARASVRA